MDGPTLLLGALGLLIFELLAVRYGVDSRLLDERDQRGWWPGSRGR